MRSCNKNKQRLLYSLQKKSDDGTYVVDDDVVVVDDEESELATGTDSSEDTGDYTVPKEFYGNIHSSGGEASSEYYGVSTSDYDAVLYTPKGEVELSETSLIWYESEPSYLDDAHKIVDSASADYKVMRVPPCLNERVYLLQKVNR